MKTLTDFNKKKAIVQKVAALTLTITLFSSYSISQNVNWTLDKAHSRLGFGVTHLMVSEVEGTFKTFEAKLTSTKDDFTDALVEMTADVKSIDTDNEQRDTHLKSPDFFDATKYPVITFKSKTFKKVKTNTYKVTGELTMHGITQTITLDVTSRTGINPVNKQTVAGFKITGTVKRKDFDIGTSAAASLIGDEVSIVANTEFIKNNQ